MIRRLRIPGLLALAIISVLLVALWMRGGDPSRWVQVESADLPIVVEAPGKLESKVHVEIGPPSVRDVWQYNLAWMIAEGSWVEQDDVIARFDGTDLEDQLRKERATLETTRQTKDKEQRNLDIALRQLNLDLVKAEGELKLVDLDLAVPESLVSSIEVRENQLRRDLAIQRVAFLRDKIGYEKEWVRSSLELLDAKQVFSEDRIVYYETVRDKFNVRSPVSGLVVYIPKPNGDRWEVGEGVWMLAKILRVADVSTLQVESTVLEADAAAIAPGQTAEIKIDAIPGMLLSSKIESIGSIVRRRSLQDRSKVFDAVLPLQDVDRDLLRPGMSVTVRVETRRITDQLTIPIEAVRKDVDGPWVAVLRGGSPQHQAIVLGERGEDRVVVREGLKDGDRLKLPEHS